MLDVPVIATPRRVLRARRAVVVVFFANALLFASWTAHIPQVKSSLGLSDAALGLALFGAPIGSVAAIVITGQVLKRVSSARMCQVALVGYCVTSLGVGLAGSPAELFVALVVWGGCQGSLDVAMNTQGVTVERAAGRSFMSGLHGAWSLGAFVGAAAGVVAVAAGVSLPWQLAVLAVLVLVVGGRATRWLLPDVARSASDAASHGSRNVLLVPGVMVLGVISFACLFCEGAAADWSAVYVRESLDAEPVFAALAYAAFSATMVTLRLSGDRLTRGRSVNRLVAWLAALSTVVLGAAILVGSAPAALAGFAALGVGLALVVPMTISAAGRLSEGSTGSTVAAVSAIGWAGFVAGPPVIGLVSHATALPVALTLLPILTAMIAVVAFRTKAFGA